MLTDFGLATLADRYYVNDETKPEHLFLRVTNAYGSNPEHSARIYDYMSKLWFMPATPILSNGGTDRGLPISCFLNTVGDSMEEIKDTWNENIELSKTGGGLGTYWGGVRSIGESVKGSGSTSGIIPFIRVQDSLSLAISQGSLRRGSASVYLDVFHPEIEEFLEIRRPTGDINRRSLNLHHGVNITDDFMQAVRDGSKFSLISPKTGKTIKRISARDLWQRMLELRLETGEPYLNFIDSVNRSLPRSQKDLGLNVRQSNLCTEITLPTDADRTAVCCLGSLNLAKWDDFSDQLPQIVKDCCEFLDNVLSDFANRTSVKRAKFSVERERAIGLGVMGWHSFLQQKMIPFGSGMAKAWNLRIWKQLHQIGITVNRELAKERGSCPDVPGQRFSHIFAVAPTANISIICGGVSAGIEPVPGNIFTHKTLSGSFVIRNIELEKIIGTEEEIWDDILRHDGSIQHLNIDQSIKNVFLTAFEIDQRWIIEHASNRQPYICQAQSVNLFLPADIHKFDLHHLHFSAWEKGMKSLYYVRSRSMKKATQIIDESQDYIYDTEECLACT